VTIIIWIVIGAMVALGSPWLIMHGRRLAAGLSRDSMTFGRYRRSKISKRRSAKIHAKAGSHPCVMISPCLGSCSTATEQRDRRYLAVDAPELPLTGCDAEQCNCRYKHYQDRREDTDRRFRLTQFNDINSKMGGEERRSDNENDRRASEEKAKPRAYFNDY
jgi:hypothetical protein